MCALSSCPLPSKPGCWDSLCVCKQNAVGACLVLSEHLNTHPLRESRKPRTRTVKEGRYAMLGCRMPGNAGGEQRRRTDQIGSDAITRASSARDRRSARGAVRVRTATRTSTCDASGTRCGRAPTTCNRHDNLCDVASHSFVRLSLPAHRYITPCPHESPPRMPPWRPSHRACFALTPALPAVPCLTMQRAPHVCMPVDAHMFHALLYAHDRC